MYDVVIVGSGPAGLSAAVNTASEGLKTLVMDMSTNFGGQASSATLIENYAGFPEGVTGKELTQRMLDQTYKFGVDYLAPSRACGIKREDDRIVVLDDSGEHIETKTVILAMGVQYRRLATPGISRYMGRGVTYGSPILGRDYQGKNFVVVGGANSAGQAALHLAQVDGSQVRLVVRGESLEKSMSNYLIEKLKTTTNVTIHLQSAITNVDGVNDLQNVWIKGEVFTEGFPVDQLFILIGAVPLTSWMGDDIERDSKGFVLTGRDLKRGDLKEFKDTCGRKPFDHETSMRGVFAAGDIRANSVHRVASAVGDGAATVNEIHRVVRLERDLNERPQA